MLARNDKYRLFFLIKKSKNVMNNKNKYRFRGKYILVMGRVIIYIKNTLGPK